MISSDKVVQSVLDSDRFKRSVNEKIDDRFERNASNIESKLKRAIEDKYKEEFAKQEEQLTKRIDSAIVESRQDLANEADNLRKENAAAQAKAERGYVAILGVFSSVVVGVCNVISFGSQVPQAVSNLVSSGYATVSDLLSAIVAVGIFVIDVIAVLLFYVWHIVVGSRESETDGAKRTGCPDAVFWFVIALVAADIILFLGARFLLLG